MSASKFCIPATLGKDLQPLPNVTALTVDVTQAKLDPLKPFNRATDGSKVDTWIY